MQTESHMKWLAKDVLIPVLLVCFAYPIAAGLWWRYWSGHAESPLMRPPQVHAARAIANSAQ